MNRDATTDPTRGRSAASDQVLTTASLLVLAAGVLAAVTVVVARSHLRVENSLIIAFVIGALLIALHFQPRRTLVVRSNLETINLDEVLFVPLVVMLEPLHSVVVLAVASLAGSLVARRSWVKTCFNLGQYLLATAAGLTVVALLGVEPRYTPGFTAALAGMIAALTMTASTALAVRSMVAFATGARLGPLLRDIGGRFRPWVGAVTLGGVGTIAVGAYPLAAVLVAIVVVFVNRAYAATFRELSGRQHAERLQRAVASLRTHTDPDDVGRDLEAAARDLLGAGAAAIVGADAEPSPHSLSAPVDAGRQLRVSARSGPGGWTEQDEQTLWTLAGVAGDVLRSAEMIARLRTITDSQSEGVIALDLECRITFANPAARHMMGVDEFENVDGDLIDTRLSLRHGTRPLAIAGMVTAQLVTHDADATLVVLDRPRLDVAYSLTPLYAERVHVGAVVVLRDVTERRAFQDALAHRALHDELTDLPNRRLLMDRIDHALARSRRSGTKHGLLFFDLDRFKLVNDSYGHLVGDKLLVQVAARLRTVLSAADSLARLSGDEFVVLVEDVATIENVTAVAERLLRVLREPHDLDGHRVYMSASIGVVLTESGQSRDQVLASADAAAYAAKAAGRDCFRVSTHDSEEVARSRLDLEARLRRSIDNGDFHVRFQPIVRTDDGEVVGVEALVRWDAPDYGLMLPAYFIPLAEETGLIVPLGRWVLEQACRTVQTWTVRHADRAPLSVSVNLSALQFSQHELAEEVAATLARTGLAPAQLCLEITETILMSDTAATVATLETLRELGVRVAIDDFGTGYSALSYLKRFPTDVVKLDRSFIGELDVDQVDTEIVGAVVRLSAALGIVVVAEGVETEAQRSALLRMRCPLMQGYLAARPLVADDFEEYWSRSVMSASADLYGPLRGEALLHAEDTAR